MPRKSKPRDRSDGPSNDEMPEPEQFSAEWFERQQEARQRRGRQGLHLAEWRKSRKGGGRHP